MPRLLVQALVNTVVVVLAGDPVARLAVVRAPLASLKLLESGSQIRLLGGRRRRRPAQVREQLPRAEVTRLLANTYGGFLAARDDPGWRPSIESRLRRCSSG